MKPDEIPLKLQVTARLMDLFELANKPTQFEDMTTLAEFLIRSELALVVVDNPKAPDLVRFGLFAPEFPIKIDSYFNE